MLQRKVIAGTITLLERTAVDNVCIELDTQEYVTEEQRKKIISDWKYQYSDRWEQLSYQVQMSDLQINNSK